jgi:outer membrane protein
MRRRNIALALLSVLVIPGPAARAQAPTDTLRLGVSEAVEHALRDGVEAAIARLDVAAAKAQVGVALSYALPEIGLSGTYTRNIKKPVIFFEFEPGQTQTFEIGEDNAWFGTLSLQQTVWASGRVSSGYNMAKERAAGAALAGDDAAAVIARNVKSAYYQALLVGEQTEIARRSLEQALRNVEQISARVERGITPEFDKLRAEVTVANRRALLTRAKNYEAIALETLKRLIGLRLDRPLELTDRLEYTPYMSDRDEIVARALDQRRDLAATRKEALAAEFQYKAQKANSRPLLYLNGNLSWQGETSNGLWPGDRESAESAAIGLSLSWPFMDGFRTKNQARAAKAQAEQARARVRQMEDVIRLQVRSSWGDVESIAEEIVGAEQAVQVARQAYDIAQVRYDKGLSTILELLDAELALIDAALNRSDTLYRYNVALAVLEYNIGEGPKLALENGE